MNVYKIELMVIDHEDIGPDAVADELHNGRYGNDCISPTVMSCESRDIGEWDDSNPLNFSNKQEVEFKRLFAAQPPQDERRQPVAWRDPSNANPGQSVTFVKSVQEQWPHIYRQPLYAAAQPVALSTLTDGRLIAAAKAVVDADAAQCLSQKLIDVLAASIVAASAPAQQAGQDRVLRIVKKQKADSRMEALNTATERYLRAEIDRLHAAILSGTSSAESRGDAS